MRAGANSLVMTKVRLTRNLRGIPFSWKAGLGDKLRISAAIRPILGRVSKGRALLLKGKERREFMKRNFPSTGADRLSGVEVWLLGGAGTYAIVNHVDHLCVQSCRPGLSTGRILRGLTALAGKIDRQMRPARNRDWGFLTASPADSGRGIGVSYLVDFSALRRTGTLDFALDRLRKAGMACRPMTRTGRRSLWHLYSAKPYGFGARSSLFRAEKTLAQMITIERAAADITALGSAA